MSKHFIAQKKNIGLYKKLFKKEEAIDRYSMSPIALLLMFCLPFFFLLFYVPFCLFPPSPGFPQPTPTLTLTLLDMHQ